MPSARLSTRWAGFTSVLCPVDFSDQSRLALRHAEALALRTRAALTVVYANDPLLIAAASAALHDRGVARRSGGELKTFVDETLAASTRNVLTVRTQAVVGHPCDAILQAASKARAGVIVVGTHGLTGADRLLMGSTTLSLLQRASVPVLAVPRGSDRLVSPAWPGTEIAAAVELDADGRTDIEHAAQIAEAFGATLQLVHVVSPIAAPRWFEGDFSALEKSRAARAQQQIEKLAAAARKRVATTTRIRHGNVADEIAAFASTTHAGLIVTALRDRTGWFGARRGSISYHVLAGAAAPVLACPPRWRPR